MVPAEHNIKPLHPRALERVRRGHSRRRGDTVCIAAGCSGNTGYQTPTPIALAGYPRPSTTRTRTSATTCRRGSAGPRARPIRTRRRPTLFRDGERVPVVDDQRWHGRPVRSGDAVRARRPRPSPRAGGTPRSRTGRCCDCALFRAGARGRRRARGTSTCGCTWRTSGDSTVPWTE